MGGGGTMGGETRLGEFREGGFERGEGEFEDPGVASGVFD